MQHVWIVISDWVTLDGDGGNEVYVYSKEEYAKQQFDELVRLDKEENCIYMMENEDYDIEEYDGYFCVFLKARYWEEHSEIRIVERVVDC